MTIPTPIKKKIINRYQLGGTVEQIALSYSVSIPSVYNILRASTVELRPQIVIEKPITIKNKVGRPNTNRKPTKLIQVDAIFFDQLIEIKNQKHQNWTQFLSSLFKNQKS